MIILSRCKTVIIRSPVEDAGRDSRTVVRSHVLLSVHTGIESVRVVVGTKRIPSVKSHQKVEEHSYCDVRKKVGNVVQMNRVRTSVRLPPALRASAATVATAVAAATATERARREAAAATTASSTSRSEVGAAVSRTATAASASSATTTSATTAVASFVGELVKPVGNLLVGFLQQLDQVSADGVVASVIEGGRDTGVTRSTSSTDSVGVLGNVGGQVVQDDVLDVGDIQTSSGNGSRDQDRGSTALELLQSPLSFSLGSVTVNSGSVNARVTQEVTQVVGHSLGLNKDQGQSVGFGANDIEKQGSLVVVFDKLDTLGNVLGSGTDSANGQEDIVLQEVSGEHLNLSRERGGEHERLSLLNAGHVLALDNLSNLRFETHVEHSVGLIKNQILDVGQRDLASVD